MLLILRSICCDCVRAGGGGVHSHSPSCVFGSAQAAASSYIKNIIFIPFFSTSLERCMRHTPCTHMCESVEACVRRRREKREEKKVGVCASTKKRKK
jgi:hypothetical protein